MAYLDILGYTALIEKAITGERALLGAAQAIQDLKSAVRRGTRLRDSLPGYEPPQGLLIRVFSDSICVSAPVDSCPASQMVVTLARLLAFWAESSLVVRGALVRGYHHDKDDVVFSPALVSAWRMEQEASYPRVLVSPDVARGYWEAIERGFGETETAPRWLWRDWDGRLFVNYLACSLRTETGKAFLGRHKNMVEEQLGVHRGDWHVRAKYEWLAGYHNRVCTTYLDGDTAATYTIPRPSAQGPASAPDPLGDGPFSRSDRVVLLDDVPDHGLAAGDVGSVEAVSEDGVGYQLGFTTATGHVYTWRVGVTAAQIRLLQKSDLPHVRELES